MSIFLNEIERGNHIGSRVVLSEAEQKLAQYIANKRKEENRKGGVEDRRISRRDIDLHGYGAELSLSKIFNLYPDMTTHLRSVSSDDAGDMQLACGLTVDVKAALSPKLIVFIHKASNPTPIYALMCGVFPEYTFFGFITRGSLFNEAHVADLGLGPRYVAETTELKELVDVVDIAEKEVSERKAFETMLFG